MQTLHTRLCIGRIGNKISCFPAETRTVQTELCDQPRIARLVESHHRPRGNAWLTQANIHSYIHASMYRYFHTHFDSVRRPCICGSRVVTTMLMEISVYPFDYKFVRCAFCKGAGARACRCARIGMGDDDNERPRYRRHY